jgi:hypothetical protein
MTAEGEPGPTSAVASRPNTDSDQSEAGEPASPPTDGAGESASPPADGAAAPGRDRLTRRFITLGKVLGVVVSLVTLIGGTVTLLFKVDPSLEPCIGGAGATFTSVQVVPRYPLVQYIRDVNNGRVPQGLPPLTGAEIRYSYSASNLSGNDVRLYATLEQILPNGDITAPPGPPPGPTNSENLQAQVGPQGFLGPQQSHPGVTLNKCSQDTSGLDWILLPRARHRHRYRVVLELYKGAANSFTDRVGVGDTPTFDH